MLALFLQQFARDKECLHSQTTNLWILLALYLLDLKKNDSFLDIIASVSLYNDEQNFAIAEHILSSHSTNSSLAHCALRL